MRHTSILKRHIFHIFSLTCYSIVLVNYVKLHKELFLMINAYVTAILKVTHPCVLQSMIEYLLKNKTILSTNSKRELLQQKGATSECSSSKEKVNSIHMSPHFLNSLYVIGSQSHLPFQQLFLLHCRKNISNDKNIREFQPVKLKV